jgi:hypothetical protein
LKIPFNLINLRYYKVKYKFILDKNSEYEQEGVIRYHESVIVNLAQLTWTMHNICKGPGFKPQPPPKNRYHES